MELLRVWIFFYYTAKRCLEYEFWKVNKEVKGTDEFGIILLNSLAIGIGPTPKINCWEVREGEVHCPSLQLLMDQNDEDLDGPLV